MTRDVTLKTNLRQAKKAGEGETLSNILRRRLADDILAGLFLPGDRLDEQQIANRFKISRTPVREALRALSASGLAELRPHRGVVVTMVDDTKLVELFEVTGEVDALCARLAAERMTAMERQALLGLEAEGSAIAVKREFEVYAAFNRRFHEAIFAGAHNAILADTASGFRVRSAPYRRMSLEWSDRMAISSREHTDIAHLIVRHDADGAYRAMKDHLTASGAVALANLQNLRHKQKWGASD